MRFPSLRLHLEIKQVGVEGSTQRGAFKLRLVQVFLLLVVVCSCEECECMCLHVCVYKCVSSLLLYARRVCETER